MIAKTPPSITCHIGAVAGRLSPSKTPVTTELRSVTVSSLLVIRQNTYSERVVEITEASTTRRARKPKITVPAMSAGISAMTTSSIMPCVVLGLDI